jgi:YD repeat-containing protein
VSVDGGATARYSYDQQNRRVSKVVPGVSRTDYIWEGSRVVEEYDLLKNGPWRTKADYLYLGDRLVASLGH